MLDVFNFASPQTANFQAFYGGSANGLTTNAYRDWIKPRGASMVRMLLIGAGTGGASGSTSSGGAGGGSGAITTWIGPAIFIPDQLQIVIGKGGNSDHSGTNTYIVWQGPTASGGYTLLTANAGTGSVTAGGAASSNNFFGASGIFSSIAGQNGGAQGSAVTASPTIFLSGAAGGAQSTTNAGANVATNYGYPTVTGGVGTTGGNGQDGYFMTQPLFLGVGGAGGGGSTTAAGGNGGNGGIGCGGGGGGRCTSGTSLGGKGGDGAVFIWSW